MQAVKINIEDAEFLLPMSHSDNYEFPTYLIDNRSNIVKCIRAYREWLKNPLNDMADIPNMEEFKKITGIIGIPFDLRDTNLYILNNDVNVVLEVEI